jgi:hypothetical protein
MKMVKSLILGSAAGLVAMSGAQAADLPVKAKAVEYVRICSLYGAGFWYIPGTDTCIKLSGYMRIDMVENANNVYSGAATLPAGNGNRFTNAYTWRSREDFDIDTRTATEYGVVRTFFDATFTWTDDQYTSNGTNALGTVYSQIGTTGVGQANNGSSGLVAAGAVGVYYAFIQFAGFTMGKAISPFSAPGFVNYPGNNFDGLVGGGGTVTGVQQFIYTAQFGNGVSGTIGVQDPTQYYQAGNLNFGAFGSAGSLTGASDIGGTEFPDIVGNILVTQAWGSAQLSAAGHDNRAAYYINTGVGSLAGHPDDKWGFAVQGAASINTPQTGAGDVLNIEAVYTDGATRYNIQDLANVGAWTTFNGSTGNVPGALGGIGFGFAPDSVFNLGGNQKLIETWGGRGGFTHNWNPYWNTSVYGAWTQVSYGSVSDAGSAASIVCASVAATAALAGITHCDPNYQIAQAGIITRWTPVKNLTFSGDFTWQHLSQNYAGTVANGGTNGMPAGAYFVNNQNNYNFLFRAQRNW